MERLRRRQLRHRRHRRSYVYFLALSVVARHISLNVSDALLYNVSLYRVYSLGILCCLLRTKGLEPVREFEGARLLSPSRLKVARL